MSKKPTQNGTGGFIKLHRCITASWQWKKATWRSAWVWLLVNAEYEDRPDLGLKRGQVYFSVNMADPEWGMSKTSASRFLNLAVASGDILWERGDGGRPNKLATGPVIGPVIGPDMGTVLGTVVGRITLLKYSKYQTWKMRDGRVAGTDIGKGHNRTNGRFLRNEEENEKNKPPLPPKGQDDTKTPKATPKISHDPEFLEQALLAIDVNAIRKIYEPKGLDVATVWDNFYEYVMKGSPRKPIPNPSDWVDFNLAFQGSCRRDLANNRNLLKSAPKAVDEDSFWED